MDAKDLRASGELPFPRYMTREQAVEALDKYGVLVDVVIVATEADAAQLNEEDR